MSEPHAETINRLVDRFRTLRHLRGWSQTELAQRCESHRAIIAKIETGQKKPSLGESLRIAEAFNIPLADLLAAEPLRVQREEAVL